MPGDTTVDVAIIGGGIAGLTTALLLKEEGKRVAVIEADHIVEGITAYTTAKITALHNLIYDHLERSFDAETAQLYAQANQAAVELVADRVKQYNIACDFLRQPAYTYTTDARRSAEDRGRSRGRPQGRAARQIRPRERPALTRSPARSASTTRRSSTRASTCWGWRSSSTATAAMSGSRPRRSRSRTANPAA